MADTIQKIQEAFPVGSCVVVVPCYNEGLRLPVAAFVEFLVMHPGYGFFFVDDGSKDDTLAVLLRLKEQSPERVAFMSLKINQGKAEAVRRGLLRALTFDGIAYLAYWDADLATPLTELPRLVSLLSTKAAVMIILGSRVSWIVSNGPLLCFHHLGRGNHRSIGKVPTRIRVARRDQALSHLKDVPVTMMRRPSVRAGSKASFTNQPWHHHPGERRWLVPTWAIT